MQISPTKKRLIIYTLFLFLLIESSGQIINLSKNVNRIPADGYTVKLVTHLNSTFDSMIKQNADSLVLLYVESVGITNYALLVSKQKKSSEVIVFKQYRTGDEVLTFFITNDTLSNLNILDCYNIMQDDVIRTIDTNSVVSHDDLVYCQFYFGGQKQILVGYFGLVKKLLGREFSAAYTKESNRFLRTPSNKHLD